MELPELPDDLAEAFDSFKLAIMHHKADGWRAISERDLVSALRYLYELAKDVEVQSVRRRGDLLKRWKKRAMDLEMSLGWIRTELRETPAPISLHSKQRMLAMIEESEEELSAFLKSVGY